MSSSVIGSSVGVSSVGSIGFSSNFSVGNDGSSVLLVTFPTLWALLVAAVAVFGLLASTYLTTVSCFVSFFLLSFFVESYYQMYVGDSHTKTVPPPKPNI